MRANVIHKKGSHSRKLLHNIEVNWFWCHTPSQKPTVLEQILIKYRSPIHNASFDTPEQILVDYSLQSRSLKDRSLRIFVILLLQFDQNDNSQEYSNVDCGVKNRQIFALKVSKEALWTVLRHFIKNCLKTIVFQRILGRWKSGYFSVIKYFGFIILTRSVLPQPRVRMRNFLIFTSVSLIEITQPCMRLSQ